MTTVEEASAVETAEGPTTATRLATGMIGPVAVVAALLSALTTFLVLANLTFVSPTYNVVVTLLAVNFVTVVLLLAIIGREVWHIVQARRRGSAGARLHVQIAALFSVIAVVPAVLVAVVASVNLDRGFDRLFLIRTRAVMENSVIVSQAYLNEHERAIQAETNFMASDVAKAKPVFDQDIDRFRQGFTTQALLRNMPVAMMLRPDQSVILKADIRLPPGVQEPPLPPTDRLAQIGDAEAVAGWLPDTNYVGALIKLKGYDDAYLFVARFADPRVLEQIKQTDSNIQEYANLEARRIGVQLAFALMYTVIALTVLLSAVWIGFAFANRLVAPIRRLIGAANLVSTGNLHVQVPVRRSEGDLAQLGSTFNKMTQELRTQRNDIMRARDLVDSRRRFTEAVLAGASAGVIGVDGNGHVSILNRSAEKLIGSSEAEALGHPLEEIVPELRDLIGPARLAGHRLVQGQTTIHRNGRDRTVSVRVTSEQSANPDHGYVVTLDDITELVTAQRTAAWADIARRIAHEIKNPLTPIQLSAERLRRKYGNLISEDRGIFEQCTDTIVRQVDDIRRMVDEFSRFARMPKPVMTLDDVTDTVRQVAFMHRVGNADIDIEVEVAEDPMPARFDRRLIAQGLTNIIKNAGEAVAAVPPDQLGRGRIVVSAARVDSDIVIDVIDNGIGLPKENRSRLLEPYVTTREKGTGLGLAIVGKILEEHGGRIELRDAAERFPGQRGAWMRLRFAAEPAETFVSEAKN
ncbi:MAG TPA: PAS domain-containing sensor histidine kinase [Xanthobacteraceae bacterium]|jgi:two-component system nitrogen regulation sensor histidine kinase NtrY|nr:PAS domain-containing sensor histidine kinase [Xanthobacteraceae bacterium]